MVPEHRPSAVARRSDQRGSILMLLPAAVLIMIVLGAVAVDRALLFGAQRELVATAQSAANDGAAAGVDVDALRIGAGVRLDPRRVDRAVAAAVATVDGLTLVRWHLDGTVLVVRLQRRVELVFTKGVPGAADAAVVRATAQADLRRS